MTKRLNLILVVFIAGIAAVTAQESPTQLQKKDFDPLIREGLGAGVQFPVPGMKVAEMCAAIAEIGKLLDSQTAILDIQSLGKDCLKITTGSRGPQAGQGYEIVFERQNGRWKETRRNRWES